MLWDHEWNFQVLTRREKFTALCAIFQHLYISSFFCLWMLSDPWQGKADIGIDVSLMEKHSQYLFFSDSLINYQFLHWTALSMAMFLLSLQIPLKWKHAWWGFMPEFIMFGEYIHTLFTLNMCYYLLAFITIVLLCSKAACLQIQVVIIETTMLLGWSALRFLPLQRNTATTGLIKSINTSNKSPYIILIYYIDNYIERWYNTRS